MALAMPTLALSQDAKSILEAMQERQIARWEGIDVYVVRQSVMGQQTQTYFQRTTIKDDAGNETTLFLPARPTAQGANQCLGGRTMTPDELDQFAGALEMTTNATGNEIENGLEDAGLPRGLLAASGSDPNATFDPRVMFGPGADFLRAAADAQREEAARDPNADGQERVDQMAMFAQNAKLVGTETIDGRNAFHLQATDIDEVQEIEGGEYRMETMNFYIDADQYVPLLMKMEGTMTSGDESRPMSIENIMTDYRMIPGSKMYESHKQIMKMSGMLSPEQEAQMAEAQTQMAELEQQMASMPASQRAMMEKMMGPQLEMMRNMSSGDGFQTEIVTESITVNPPMTGPDGKACQ